MKYAKIVGSLLIGCGVAIYSATNISASNVKEAIDFKSKKFISNSYKLNKNNLEKKAEEHVKYLKNKQGTLNNNEIKNQYSSEILYSKAIDFFAENKIRATLAYISAARKVSKIDNYENLLKSLLGSKYNTKSQITKNEYRSISGKIFYLESFNGISINREKKDKSSAIKHLELILKESEIISNK